MEGEREGERGGRLREGREGEAEGREGEAEEGGWGGRKGGRGEREGGARAKLGFPPSSPPTLPPSDTF